MVIKRVYIGTSGYNYLHWLGVFYPESLKQNEFLAYYSNHFDTVELNVTFYRLPQEKTFISWYKKTPDNFNFVVKGSRLITHRKRLVDCREPLRLLLKNSAHLQEKCKAILWQFPPYLKVSLNLLKEFFSLIEEETPKYFKKGLKHAFEFRHPSWFNESIYNLFNSDFTFCYADYPACAKEASWGIPNYANFAYIRRHGATSLYSSCYSDEELASDAKKIKEILNKGKEVYIFFNNDAYGYAVQNAKTLINLLNTLDK